MVYKCFKKRTTMLYLLKIFSLLHLHYILVECLVPNTPDLSVRQVDKKVIERKRQDTLDMCRIFTAESKKDIFQNIEKGDTDKTVPNKYNKVKKYKRTKRDIGKVNAINPSLNVEDEQRVETIVDRLYDDLLEKGQNIPYRRKELPKSVVKTVANVSALAPNQTGRRFNFMPAELVGPTSERPSNQEIPADDKSARFKHGIVPYFIDSKTYDSHLAETIMKAFDYFEKATCIRLQRLRERPTDLQSLRNVIWLYITNPSGIRQCVHSNDRAEIKGVQMIVFGYDCMSLGDITHEVMHVLGFSHEHVRPDRDQYITILWDNIKPGYRKYFEVHKEQVVQNLPYDYASVLHYPSRAFSRNGQVTILTEPGIKVGQREGLSEMDVEKIGALYSSECVKRNREYLLKTCPSVVKSDLKPPQITQQEIEDYFEFRLWPFAVVNYKFKDSVEFSTEEQDNIRTVIRHIEKETCIEFRDLTVIHKPGETSSESSSSQEPQEKYVQLGVSPNDTQPTLPTFTSTEVDNYGDFAKVKELNTNDISSDAGRAGKKDTKPNQDKKAAEVKKKPLRTKKVSPSPSRRHADNVLVLARSPQPGCQCPRPGSPDGRYVLKINADCFNSVNDLLHIFVHILGLDHQHNMHDRDSYLHIVWDQLTGDVRQEMKKKLPPAASVGFGYDYQSVMHYPWLQIKNGRTNIMYPIWNDGWAMGHWQGLSSMDVQKLNLLYFKQCVARKQQAMQAEENRRV